LFGLAQIVDGVHFRGYFYNEGYIRTSSFKYKSGNWDDRDTHLTNDAVQNNCSEYGKYEPGNKISFKDFATFLMAEKGVDFNEVIVPKMRKSVKDTL
jgi:tubulin---tyrosine ligase